MKIIFKIAIALDITEKRLLKLGFKKKTFTWKDNPKDVYVMGRHMNDCGSFEDTITYDPIEKQIDAQYGGNFPNFNHTKVETMYEIKEFLKTHSYPDDEIEYEKKYGKSGEGFDVILKSPGMQRIGVMKFLKTHFILTLDETKELVNSAPCKITNYHSKEMAKELKENLEKLGAEVELK